MVETLADLATKGCVTVVVVAGDSMAALDAFGKTQAVTSMYPLTGGGATLLELLAGDVLTGVLLPFPTLNRSL
jgi:3-phosphoglycerate kinase